jgi:hypothetical protein
MKQFDKTLEERKNDCLGGMKKNPNSVPIYIIYGDGIKFTKSKFMAPQDMTISHFMHFLRKYVSLTQEEATFPFINNSLPRMSAMLSEYYKTDASEDGFLYITVTKESTFGFDS